MDYWLEVHRRAFRETRELARMDSFGRGLITLSVIVIPAVVGWEIGHTLDPIARGLSALGALTLAAILIYGWKVFSLPPRMAREASMATAEIAAKLESRQARQEAAQLIATLHSEGHGIFVRQLASEAELEAWKDDVQKWRERLFEAVVRARGAATAQTLDTITTVTAGSYQGVLNEDHNTRKLYLATRLSRVRDLAAQLEREA